MSVKWIRGEEHESKMLVMCPELKCSITVSLPFFMCGIEGRNIVEKQIVDAFKIWPHPDSKDDNETDERRFHREASYLTLCESEANYLKDKV